MVSPELLRRYPFFCCLDEAQQKAIALITKEVLYDRGRVIFEEGQPADVLYVLLEGCVDLYYTASGDHHDQLLVAEIDVGEPFSISALIEPHVLTATAQARTTSRVIEIKGAALRALCEVDNKLGYAIMRQAAKSAMDRLHYTRVQLAAARHAEKV